MTYQSQSSRNSSLSVEDMCRKLKPIFGAKIDKIFMNYKLADSREARDEIEQALNLLYRKHLSELLEQNILLEPPKKEVVSGEYPLATVSYAGKDLHPFCLHEKDWIRHVCITGMSGSGKTNLAFKIIENFIQKNKPFIVFDWKKSFRPLMNADPNLLNFTVGNEKISNHFRININRPPRGINPREWLNTLCDLIIETFAASFGVHKLISETLDEAFKERGVYKGSEDYPTWVEIRYRLEDKIKKVKGREANWLESALRIAHVLTFGDFGKVINSKKSEISVESLLDKRIMFELSSLSNIEKTFFCSFLLTYIYKLKKAGNTGEEKFRQAIIVDEAHNIFLSNKPSFVNESVTDTVYREIREYGVSLICLDQHISKLSPIILGNSACHIAFQQQLPEDIKIISRIAQLGDREIYFSRLPVGSAIVKLAENYFNPFLVRVDLSNLKNKVVTDEEIRDKMNCYKKELIARDDKEFIKESTGLDEKQSNLAAEIERRLKTGESRQDIENFLQELRNYAVEVGKKDPTSDIDKVVKIVLGNVVTAEEGKLYKAPNSQELSDEESNFLDFLKICKTEKKSPSTTEIYKALSLSARKGNEIKNRLMERNLIKIIEEKTSTGRKKIVQIGADWEKNDKSI